MMTNLEETPQNPKQLPEFCLCEKCSENLVNFMKYFRKESENEEVFIDE